MEKEAEFDIKTLVNYIENEYDVDRDVVISIIEESMTKASRKNRNFTSDLRIVIDRNDYKVHVFDTVVVSDENTGVGFVNSKIGRRINNGNQVHEGDLLEVEYPAKSLGRVCARESRMMILQKIKMAKNINTISRYKDRTGDIVSGIVSGIDRGNIIINVGGKTDMVIPKKERILKERFNVGDSISGIIIGVNEKQKNSPIVVSRSNSRFLEELMKREISELADGTLEICGVSRDPGHRAKVLVKSNNSKVDPVGSCVGRRGERIKNVMNELSGEHIDIVRYSDNLTDLVRDAISPAKTENINILADGSVTVTVNPDEYAKAVGKFGTNARLASHIVGHRINVRKSIALMTFEEQKEYAIRNLSEIFSISTNISEQIVNAGFLNPDGIAAEDEASFLASTGLEEVVGKGVYAAALAVANSGIKI